MTAHLIAEEGPLKGLVLSFKEGHEWILGRNPEESDFVIEDSTVSRRHLRCVKKDDGIYLSNLSRVNPTLFNGEKLKEEQLLKPGDRIQIGYTVFRYSEEEIPEEAPQIKKHRGAYDALFDELDEFPATQGEEPAPLEEIREVPSAYDTIFEENDSEEIPFHLMPDAPFILKVISGPNAGAEIGIEKGKTYVLGKDPNSSDITFQDLSVSKQHARLKVSEEGVLEIEDLQSKNGTAVNGTPILGITLITPQDMISLGTTLFFLIDREAPQETIYSPMLPYEMPSQAAAPPPEELVPEKLPAASWKEMVIPTRYLVIAGSFATMLLVVFLSFFSLFKAYQVDLVQKEPSQEIALAMEKFPALQFSFNPASGKLFLVGHVLTAIDYQELFYRIEQMSFITDTEETIVIDELVAKNMNDVLAENASWKGVTIQSTAPGQFIAQGYVTTNEEGSRLADYLATHFPYLNRLNNGIIVEENLLAQLSALLSSGGFSAVAIQLANGEVILTGPYSEKEAKRFGELVQEIHRLPGVRSVKNFSVSSTAQQAAIDISQQYKVTGTTLFHHRGYSVVLNGKIYTLGDTVDGMQLITIDPSLILFEKDGVKYKVDYTH